MNAPIRTPATFTNAEYNRLIRSGGFGDTRVELRGGLITKMSPQFAAHARTKHRLTVALEHTLAASGRPWQTYTEVSVDFGAGFAPMPDIVIWDEAAVSGQLEDDPIPANAVRLIVEIAVSSLADDLGDKLIEYARGGLAEYWVADVKGRAIFRHAEPSETGYARREVARFGEPTAWLTLGDLVVDTQTL